MRLFILGALALLSVFPVLAAPLTAGPNEAFVLLNNTAAFREKSMGVLEYSENLTLGDRVSLEGGVVKEKYNGNERDYYKAKLPSGKEGFVRTSMLGVGGTLGIVKADSSFLYSEPRDVKITEQSLTRGQLVVVLKTGATDDFIPVVAYDEAKDVAVTSGFVAKSDVSVNDVDVNAIILLTVAKSQKNPVLRKNLLTVAASKYSTSIFMDLVSAQLGTAGSGSRAVKPLVGSFQVNDDNVNLRDIPNEAGSKVVGTLAKGSSVDVIEVTVDSFTVGGQTAPWYHVKAPNGWVFGSFLTPAP